MTMPPGATVNEAPAMPSTAYMADDRATMTICVAPTRPRSGRSSTTVLVGVAIRIPPPHSIRPLAPKATAPLSSLSTISVPLSEALMQRVTLADLGDLFEQPWLATLATHRKDGSVLLSP